MTPILRLQHQHDGETSKPLLKSLKPCISIHLHPIQRSSPAEADPTRRSEASPPFPQVLLQSFEMFRWDRCCYSFAFVFAPCPEKGNSFESFKSQFLRRLAISNQCCLTSDKSIHREAIVKHLTNLGNIPIPGFWIIQHDHHLADTQLYSFLVPGERGSYSKG